jgi:hypothetical protein
MVFFGAEEDITTGYDSTTTYNTTNVVTALQPFSEPVAVSVSNTSYSAADAS